MTAFFERPGPRWFNIPAHRPFADDLARGLYEALSPFGPEALSDALVLTPTRRGARAVADAFVRAADGRAVLPPQMRPLGDLEAGIAFAYIPNLTRPALGDRRAYRLVEASYAALG